jgi:hypothetical protein
MRYMLLFLFLSAPAIASLEGQEQRALVRETVSSWNDADDIADPLLSELKNLSWGEAVDIVAKTCDLCNSKEPATTKIEVATELMRHKAQQRREIKVLVVALRAYLLENHIKQKVSDLVDKVASIPYYQRAYICRDLFLNNNWTDASWSLTIDTLQRNITCLHNMALIVRYKVCGDSDIQQAVDLVTRVQ